MWVRFARFHFIEKSAAEFMPNSRSAKKSLRQSQDNRARNRVKRTVLRNALKKCRAAAGTADAEPAFRLATKKLDQAAAKRLIHPNTAARLKSRLSKVLKDAKAKPEAAAPAASSE